MVSIPSNPAEIENAFAQAEGFFRKKNTLELGKAFNILMQITEVTDAQREMRKKYLALLNENVQARKASTPVPAVLLPPPAYARPRVATDQKTKQVQSARTGLELRAAKREAREIALIKTMDIPAQDLLPQSISASHPKAKAILKACKKLVSTDVTDIKGILACIPELAQACVKFSPDLSIPSSILFVFCIRRDIDEATREEIFDQLTALLDTRDKDLSDSDTDEMVEPDDDELKEAAQDEEGMEIDIEALLENEEQ